MNSSLRVSSLLLASVVLQIGLLGLPAATTYFIARNRGEARAVVHTVRAAVFIQAVLVTLIQAGLLWLFVAGEPVSVWTAGLLTLVILPTTLGQEYGLAILQGQGRFLAFNLLRSLPVSLYGFVTVVNGRLSAMPG